MSSLNSSGFPVEAIHELPLHDDRFQKLFEIIEP